MPNPSLGMQKEEWSLATVLNNRISLPKLILSLVSNSIFGNIKVLDIIFSMLAPNKSVVQKVASTGEPSKSSGVDKKHFLERKTACSKLGLPSILYFF